MRDPSAFVGAVVLLALIVVAAAVLWKFRARTDDKAEAAERARRDRLLVEREKAAIESGTHRRRADGAVVPICRVVGCVEEATVPGFCWSHGDGMGDLVRRWFGAPPRVRPARSGVLELCAGHEAPVKEDFRLELAKTEAERASNDRDAEVRLARFERVGVYERVGAQTAKHEKEIGGRKRRSEAPAPSKVVPISGRTGS